MLKIVNPGKPSAFFDEETPSSDEAAERISQTGDPDAADSVFRRRDPSPNDGDTDAIFQDETTGETFRYDYANGMCQTMDGEELPSDYADRVLESGLVPHGNASSSEDLKTLIANVVPLIGSADNVTLIEEDGQDDE